MVTELALLVVQVSVELPPVTIACGSAVSVHDGADGTVVILIFLVHVTVPPLPFAVNV
jgi:uncharacterized protein (DUF983 family)